MSELKGQALLAYGLDAARSASFERYFIITPDPDPRATLARRFGFEVIDNPSPESGQGASLARAISHLWDLGIREVCVCLGDMPFVTGAYLNKLRALSGPSDIVFSHTENGDQPPAIFKQEAMQALTRLDQDQGARKLDWSGYNISRLPLPPELAFDFDRPDDFKNF